MGDSNVDGDGGGVDGVDGDGSGGTSPSRQGARTETSIPGNWSSTAAALRKFSGKNTDLFRVFASKASYRRMGDVRGWPGPPHHRVACPGGHPRHQVVWLPPGPPYDSSLDSVLCRGKIGTLGFVSSNSENISCVTFLKHKNSRKQELALWHLVNRLVPENA
jgi:hypothetical protein